MKVYLVIKQLKSEPSQWIVDKADVRKDVALAYRTKAEQKNSRHQYYVLDTEVTGDHRKTVKEMKTELEFHTKKVGEATAKDNTSMVHFQSGNVSALQWSLGIHD